MEARPYGSDNEQRANMEVPNPFIFESSTPWYRAIQVVFMSVTIAPVRLVLMIVPQLIACLLAVLTLIGVSEEELSRAPLTGWRRSLKHVVFKLGRLATMFSGFTIVNVKGRQVDPAEAPVLVAAPHSTLMDSVLIFLLNECPGIVTKKEIASAPIVGSLLRLTQPILVEVNDAQARHTVLSELERRSNSGGLWHQTLIFPEGTTTNRKSLALFKHGAFTSGRPVQPVTMTFTDAWDTVTWTWFGGPPGWLQGWISMCKLNIGLTVEFLPVYKPSSEEQNNPNLYADNVRKVMARSLGIPCSDLSQDDARRMYKEHKLL